MLKEKYYRDAGCMNDLAVTEENVRIIVTHY